MVIPRPSDTASRPTGPIRSDMGWQDRDYAKWSDDERKRFLGTSSSQPVRQGSPNAGSSNAGKALAIGISALALFGGGAALHFGIPIGSHHAPTPSQPPAVTPPAAAPGTRLVCSQRDIDPANGQLRCTAYSSVPTGTPT